jgi:5-methylcytosine-specific restriction endonuclease McrA
MKRKIRNTVQYPNFTNKFRHIHSVLRDEEGYMVYSEMIDGKIYYRKTDLLDLENVKADKSGRRGFNVPRDIPKLKKHIINDDFKGELYQYCIHQENQKLLPISEYTINRNTKAPHKLRQDGHPLQPYCKESKQLYVNSRHNKLRTKDQLLEGTYGSRTRGIVTAILGNPPNISINEIFEKFNNCCFKCSKPIDINDRKSYQIDHFMPASGYWPLIQDNATLLCKDCNQSKKDNHPSVFYSKEKFEILTKKLIKIENIEDSNYILNDKILVDFDQNFDIIISRWEKINRNKISFKKYINKEIKRIEKLDCYKKHTNLLKKLKKYEESIQNT